MITNKPFLAAFLVERSGRSGWIAALIFSIAAALPAQTPVESYPSWGAQLPTFHPEAPLTDQPAILYFTATWCGYCKQMERTTLVDTDVLSKLATVRHVKLDFDAQPELAEHYHVTGIPAFVAVNERGEEVARVSGAMEPSAFLSWLEAAKKRAGEVIVRGEKAKAERAWLAEQLVAGDPETKNAVQEKLFDLLARGEPASRDFARKALTAQSQSDRTVCLVGLERPDLAVRIAAANLLRAQLGHDFAFDPWASREERRVALANLREALLSQR